MIMISFKAIFNNLIASIIWTLTWPLVTIFISRIKNKSWFSIINKTPIWIFIILISTSILWILTTLIYKIKERLSKIKQHSVNRFIYKRKRIMDDTRKERMPYKNVIWKINYPIKAIDRTISLDEIFVDVPPYCPKCTTELDEKETFFGNFIWNCCKCGLRIKSKVNCYDLREEVRKIAKSNAEKQK